MTIRGLATVSILCALMFAALLAGLLGWERIAAADAAFNGWLGPLRFQPFVTLLLWTTELGAIPAILAVCVTTTGVLWVAQLSYLVLPLWIAFLGAQLSSWSVKYLVGRSRPEFLDLASATSSSFPSGHSTSSMAVYGFLAFILARHGPSRALSVAATLSLAALILLIGFSRLFLGVHYASDVLGGFLVGGFWLLLAIGVSKMGRLCGPAQPSR